MHLLSKISNLVRILSHTFIIFRDICKTKGNLRTGVPLKALDERP